MTEPRNLTHKLLAAHLSAGELVSGEEIDLDVDQILIEDATGSMTALQFEKLGVDRISVPLAVMYVDHNVLQTDDKNMDEHRYLQSFSARYGVHYSRPGNGISHYVHLERFAKPGELLLGADSHSTMAGAVGMFAAGAGGLDVAVAMAGHGFTLECPKVVGVELRGELPGWVQSKDIILELLRRHGVRGGVGRVFEFTGEGASALSVMERGTICNMITEMGATAAVFPSDERVREWLAAQEREDDYAPRRADEGAAYDDEVEVVELSELEPLIAKPHSPGNVAPVSEVAGTKTVQVCVGSSVNSSYENLATASAVLRENIVHPSVEMTITPGSRQILDTVSRSGVYQDLVAAGARVLEPVCGPCIGVGQAPSAGEPSVRTFNRNFPGRSGTADDEVYLCSPATAAATALRGEISDPRELGDPPRIEPAPPDPAIDARHILSPPPPEEARSVEIVRGPNIVPPPEGRPLPETLEGRVLIAVGDDVSTGDMAPDGMGMSLWSNIPECAKHMFRRQDPGFHDRALEWGGGFIVGGHNYGQGSSREQAALSALYLGVRAVVAKSFARIHRDNLIGQGVLPLVFADEEDHDRVSQGDAWKIEGARETLSSGETRLAAKNERDEEIMLEARLLPRERDTLLAGGMLGRLRAGGPED